MLSQEAEGTVRTSICDLESWWVDLQFTNFEVEVPLEGHIPYTYWPTHGLGEGEPGGTSVAAVVRCV